MPGGRPSSLTLDRLQAAELFLSKCPLLYILAGRIGVTYTTVKNWMRAGLVETVRREKGREPAAKYDNHVRFLAAVKNAQAKWMEELTDTIRNTPRGWERYAWMLERCFPQHFSLNRLEIRLLRKELDDLKKQVKKFDLTSSGIH
jgi:hypothetical protein